MPFVLMASGTCPHSERRSSPILSWSGFLHRCGNICCQTSTAERSDKKKRHQTALEATGNTTTLVFWAKLFPAASLTETHQHTLLTWLPSEYVLGESLWYFSAWKTVDRRCSSWYCRFFRYLNLCIFSENILYLFIVVTYISTFKGYSFVKVYC